MHQKKMSLEIDNSQLDKNIAMLEKDMEKHPERSAEIRKEQANLLRLFYKLRQVAFVKSKSTLISMVTNFIVFNGAALTISNIKGPVEFNLIMLITLFVCLILANVFLLKAIKAWAVKKTIKTNQQIEDSKTTLRVLDDK